jgi:glutamate/tyrosine decarboxylase-like PLP-dependent enzyme
MAHVTCLNAARHALLARQGWDVGRDGLAGSPRLRVIASEAVHGTTTRALKLLGIGTAQMTTLPSDANYRLTPETLKAELAKGPGAPTIVVLMAGDVNRGAFDPFDTLIPRAHAAGAWVHVDGAMGSWAHAAPARRHLLAGVAQADSWATDGHKWLNTPYDCGYAFVADAEAHRMSLEHHASYLAHATDVRDQMDWTPEHSRRARGFATWAALRELGKGGVADLVERLRTRGARVWDHYYGLIDIVASTSAVEYSPDVEPTLPVALESDGTPEYRELTVRERSRLRPQQLRRQVGGKGARRLFLEHAEAGQHAQDAIERVLVGACLPRQLRYRFRSGRQPVGQPELERGVERAGTDIAPGDLESELRGGCFRCQRRRWSRHGPAIIQ